MPYIALSLYPLLGFLAGRQAGRQTCSSHPRQIYIRTGKLKMKKEKGRERETIQESNTKDSGRHKTAEQLGIYVFFVIIIIII